VLLEAALPSLKGSDAVSSGGESPSSERSAKEERLSCFFAGG